MEHSSQETFKRQKSYGGLCILRQVTVHGRYAFDVVKREIDRFPEYKVAYSQVYQEDMQRSLVRKEEEYWLADLIVANSGFVKETFVQAGVAADKIVVIPTGCPAHSDRPANAGRGRSPLVFLFVGVLSLHKGLPYLFRAWRLLNPQGNAELWLLGNRLLTGIAFEKQGIGIKYFGRVSQSNLARIYEKTDVFILPTLFEGCAYAVLEALSWGLPIITTRESGCGELVQNGDNGFIIEAANAESLSQTMA